MKPFLFLLTSFIVSAVYSQNSSVAKAFPSFEACQEVKDDENCFKKQFQKTLYQYYKEPEIVAKDNYKGNAYLVFEVDQQGVFQLIFVDTNYQEIEAALQLAFQKLPKIKPTHQDGVPVSFRQTARMQIPFKKSNHLQFEEEVAPAPPPPPAPAVIEMVEDDAELEEMIVVYDENEIYEDVEIEEIEIEEDDADDDEVPFSIVEEVPVFPGCENEETNQERRTCMSQKIQDFANTNFNTELASELGLSGKIRVFVRFKIDKTGNVVNIDAKSSHPKLSQEGIRVVGELQSMKPGKQSGSAVDVTYMLPITFQIQD